VKVKKKLFKKGHEAARAFLRALYTVENIKDLMDFKLPGEDKPILEKGEIDFTKHFQQEFAASGIKEVADEFGVPTISFDDEEWVEQPNPDGVFLKKIWLSRTTLESDVIINLDPMEVPTTKAAVERGLGTGNLKDIEVLGTQIGDVKILDFKRPVKRRDI